MLRFYRLGHSTYPDHIRSLQALETVDLMKKDLSELKDTMATEVSEITSAAKEGRSGL